MCDDVAITAGPLLRTLFRQAAAVPAESLHGAHRFGATSQPPEIQRKLPGRDFVEMKPLQLTEAVSEIAHGFSPVISLQMATDAVALGGEFRVLLLVLLTLFDGGIPREAPRFVTLCHNTECITHN